MYPDALLHRRPNSREEVACPGKWRAHTQLDYCRAAAICDSILARCSISTPRFSLEECDQIAAIRVVDRLKWKELDLNQNRKESWSLKLAAKILSEWALETLLWPTLLYCKSGLYCTQVQCGLLYLKLHLTHFSISALKWKFYQETNCSKNFTKKNSRTLWNKKKKKQ